MSLVKTLAKVAIGMAIAKGTKSVLGGGASGNSGGGLADALGGMLGGAKSTAGGAAGGLGGLLGSITNGQQSGTSGGLGGALGGMLGGNAGSSNGGTNPLEGLLGSLTGQGSSPMGQAGGLGGLLDGLGGAGASAGGLGGLLTQAMTPGAQMTRTPSQSEEHAAQIMISAMLQAAKSDGQIDAQEEGALMKALGDLDANERAIIQAELNKPVNPAAVAAEVPTGMEQQTYLMSLMAIDLDSQAEAQYLHNLAQAMDLAPTAVNALHQRLNLAPLYT